MTGTTEVWQARIGHDLAAQLRADSEVLGLNGRAEIVRAALQLLHRRAAEERMPRDVDEFYAGVDPPLPVGVLANDDVADDMAEQPDRTGSSETDDLA
jgi:hypothetical protein